MYRKNVFSLRLRLLPTLSTRGLLHPFFVLHSLFFFSVGPINENDIAENKKKPNILQFWFIGATQTRNESQVAGGLSNKSTKWRSSKIDRREFLCRWTSNQSAVCLSYPTLETTVKSQFGTVWNKNKRRRRRKSQKKRHNNERIKVSREETFRLPRSRKLGAKRRRRRRGASLIIGEENDVVSYYAEQYVL